MAGDARPPDNRDASPKIILLATDGSQASTLAARKAAEFAQAVGSELHLLHVGPTLPIPWTPTDEELLRRRAQEVRKQLDAEVERVRVAGGEVTQAHLRFGEAAAKIIITAEELGADLIVVGSKGLGGIRRALMGSVSDSVVRHAHCPVLVVRPELEP